MQQNFSEPRSLGNIYVERAETADRIGESND